MSPREFELFMIQAEWQNAQALYDFLKSISDSDWQAIVKDHPSFMETNLWTRESYIGFLLSTHHLKINHSSLTVEHP